MEFKQVPVVGSISKSIVNFCEPLFYSFPYPPGKIVFRINFIYRYCLITLYSFGYTKSHYINIVATIILFLVHFTTISKCFDNIITIDSKFLAHFLDLLSLTLLYSYRKHTLVLNEHYFCSECKQLHGCNLFTFQTSWQRRSLKCSIWSISSLASERRRYATRIVCHSYSSHFPKRWLLCC